MNSAVRTRLLVSLRSTQGTWTEPFLSKVPRSDKSVEHWTELSASFSKSSSLANVSLKKFKKTNRWDDFVELRNFVYKHEVYSRDNQDGGRLQGRGVHISI